MTLLNEKSIKGLAQEPKNWKWKKAKWWYVLTFDEDVQCLVDFGCNMGLEHFCILENKIGKTIASGYLLNIADVKPYKNEFFKNKRGI